MADAEPSLQALKIQLFNSLKSTGTLDSLKSQLRARLLDHLRDHDKTFLEYKGTRKPSVTDRILSSLFLDYLTAYGYYFTQSVFLPESQAASWPAFTFKEMVQLLHLDPTSSFHHGLNIALESKGCLAQQLVMVLQHMPFRTTQDSSTQTAQSGLQDLDSCLRDIDETCLQKKNAERQLAFHTLEERLNVFRHEFEARVNAEVALQVNRIREYETNAIRTEEENRYQRKLASVREEMEHIHKNRLKRICEREESLMERLVAKEKVIETSAYEQRQTLLTSITVIQDREEKLKLKEDLQERLQNTLQEKDSQLRLKEEDIAQRAAILHAQALENAQKSIKDLEEQLKLHQEQLQSERALLEVEWATYREDKSRLDIELAAVKTDKHLVYSLHEQLASKKKKHKDLVNSLLHQLSTEEEQRKLLLKRIQDLEQEVIQNMDPSAKTSILCVNSIDYTSDAMCMGKGCKACQQQQRSWAKEQKKMQETIKQLEKAVDDAYDSLIYPFTMKKIQLLHGTQQASEVRKSVQLQLKISDSELLETVTLLRKTQYALELERIHHFAFRSQIASCLSVSSQDKVSKELQAIIPGGTVADEQGMRAVSIRPAAGQMIPEEACVILGQLLASSLLQGIPLNSGVEPKEQGSPPHDKLADKQNKSTGRKHRDRGTYSPQSESGPNPSHERQQDSDRVRADDVKDIEARKKPLLHKGRKTVAYGLEASSSSGSTGHNKKQGSLTGNDCTSYMLHPGQPPNSHCHPSPLGSRSSTYVHVSPQESIQRNMIYESKRSEPHDINHDTSQSNRNYYLMGTNSRKGTDAALEVQPEGKTVTHTSFKDTQREILETSGVQCAGGVQKKGYPEGLQEFFSQITPEHQQTFDKESEGRKSLLSDQTSTGSTSINNYHTQAKEIKNLSFADGETPLQTTKLQQQSADSPQHEMRRIHTRNKALQMVSLLGNQNRSQLHPELGSYNSRQKEGLSIHSTTATNATHQESITRKEMKHQPTKAFMQEVTSDLAKTVLPSSDCGQFPTAKATDEQEHAESSRQISSQQEAQGVFHGSRSSSKEKSTSSTCYQWSDREEVESENQIQGAPSLANSRDDDGLPAQSEYYSSSNSSSLFSDRGHSNSCERIGILGQACSDESCSNHDIRNPSISNTHKISSLSELVSDQSPPQKDEQEGKSEDWDAETAGWGVQSEQDSYSPVSEPVDWVEDVKNNTNAANLHDGNEFLVQEN